ncbi:carbohydrate-binding protein, partial [Kibdelosporangium lantanae]
RIRNGTVAWDHPGFTGRGFVDYANSVGSSVEWIVSPSAATSTNVVFRYANGGNAPRPMAIAVNGSLVASVVFPVTYGWSDWRTLTVRVNLVPGANSVIATAITQDGGPNIDKITLDAFPA